MKQELGAVFYKTTDHTSQKKKRGTVAVLFDDDES
jgi:hypothetical protein